MIRGPLHLIAIIIAFIVWKITGNFFISVLAAVAAVVLISGFYAIKNRKQKKIIESIPKDIFQDDKKIPCQKCGTMILPRTAYKFEGLCARCAQKK